ncbi:MAG TPA: molybdopterin-dependent oxidoreductase [Candidatus Binataceae bacterium]|jgi:DMSO/TMAO reductase YedYZ molybdopterin-dependent catalytic subunit|nr:molybdopterin-dependent oxidoreductase [Candidatus Binataceae bacterium]
MQLRRPGLSRRRFLALAGTTAALASIPLTNVLSATDGTETATARFGGLTPNERFYVTSYSGTPAIDPAQWTLKIHGLVNHPRILTYAEIRRLPAITQVLTLECISNPPDGDAISTARWTGTRLKPILDEAGIRPQAKFALMRAADGYYTSVPLSEIIREENWMPYLMNGVALPSAHGFPVRIFIPGKYGMKQPKWLTEIEFIDHEYQGYWEARGWSDEAWRKVNSGFFSPRPSGGILDILSLRTTARVSGPTDIYGWALAGPSGIKRVEVSPDGGRNWSLAQIISNASPYVWTVWKYHFAPPRAGDYTIRVRATDGNGTTQPPSDPQMGAGMSGQPQLRIQVDRA